MTSRVGRTAKPGMVRAMRTGSARRCHGATYVMLLAIIAILGVVAANSISIGSTMARRNAEQQLLGIGMEFQQALRSYAGIRTSVVASAVGAGGPRELAHLLRDPRAPGIRRHLRQIYADPLTGKAEWGLVHDPSGSIVGIYSLAGGVPIKREGFDLPTAAFDNAENYQQWVFGLPISK